MEKLSLLMNLNRKMHEKQCCNPDPYHETMKQIRYGHKKSTKIIRISYYLENKSLLWLIYMNNKLMNKKKS